MIVVELGRLERRLRVERMMRSQLRESKLELWGRRVGPALTWAYRASVLISLLLLLEQEGKKVIRLSRVDVYMAHISLWHVILDAH